MTALAVSVHERAQLQVFDIDPLTDPRWAALVERHPDRLVFHHPAWLRTLQAEYPRPMIGLGCQDTAGRLRGVLALSPTRGLPLGGAIAGRRLSSLPRTPIAGPLALDDEASSALIRAAVERTRAAKDTQLQLKQMTPLPDAADDGLQEVAWRTTYVLDLQDRPAGDGRGRRRNQWAVNKARKAGVRVRAAETEAELRAWHRLYLGTMRGLAVPARSYRFFEAAWRHLQQAGMMRLLIAEQDGRMLAGSLFLMLGSTVFYAFTGWQRADHSLRANDLLHWQAIDQFQQAGYRYYDFGEVAGGQQSLAAFKSKWGAQPRQLYRYHFPAQAERGGGALESGRLGGVAADIWRRLPLPVTATVGDCVYRRL
jgi:hypothetical protein